MRAYEEVAMMRRALPARCKVWLAWTLAILLPAVTLPLTAIGAERVVLCEEFTSHG
jgi:hypothetical protein